MTHPVYARFTAMWGDRFTWADRWGMVEASADL